MRILVVRELDGESDDDLDRVIQKLKSELPSPPDQIIVLRYCGTTPDGKRFVKLHGYPNNLRIPGFNTGEPHDGAQSETSRPRDGAPPVLADVVESEAPDDPDEVPAPETIETAGAPESTMVPIATPNDLGRGPSLTGRAESSG